MKVGVLVEIQRAMRRQQAAASWLALMEWLALAAAMLVLPLWVSRAGEEMFRTPKLLLLRGEGVLLATLAITAALLTRRQPAQPSSAEANRFGVLVTVIAGWTAITTIASRDIQMSLPSTLTVVASICIFVAAMRAARRPAALLVLFPAPLVIAAIAILQTSGWNQALTDFLVGPISEAELTRSSPISLLGYRTDVGTYLVAPAVCAFAVFLVTRSSRLRVASIVAALVLIGGIIASTTITAIGALSVSLLTMAWLRSRKAGLNALLAVALAAGMGAALYPPLLQRIGRIERSLRAGDWDTAITHRVVAFLAAGEMIARHPFTGIGPGLFKKEYFDHRIAATEKHAGVLRDDRSGDIFEEAHNDHLQVAAETGIPGYALFVVATVSIARLSWIRKRRPPGSRDTEQSETDELAELARLTSLPVIVSLYLLALAQTPLQLAVTILSYSYIAGMCAGWATVTLAPEAPP